MKSIDKSNSSIKRSNSTVKNRTTNANGSKDNIPATPISTSEAIHYDDSAPLARIVSAVNPTAMQVSRRACTIDSKKHSEPDRYFRENIFQYVVGITCWIALIDDTCHDSKITYEFLGQIKTRGLAEVIGNCKDASAWLIEAVNTAQPRDIATISYAGFGWLYPVLCQAEYGKLSDILQVLRFLVRFTAVDADAFEKQAFAELSVINLSRYKGDHFLERNSREADSYTINYHYRFSYYLTRIRRVFDKYKLDELVECIVPGKFEWSDGHCSDGITVYEKLRAFSKREPSLYSNPLYPISTASKGEIRNRKVTVKAVPKNYKKPRLIFPQDSYSSAYLHQMRKLLQMRLASVTGINLSKQQSVNRAACIKASTGSGYDTIDHSSASDCIAWCYYTWCMPEKFVKWLSLYRERTLKIGQENQPCWIAFTAGNPVTFVLETMFFHSVATVATEIASEYDALFGEGVFTPYLKPLVYGDDVMIDHRATSVYFSICEILDLKVNSDKSFVSGFYRESCGIEAYQGTRLDNVYWPRKIVGNSTKSEDAFLLSSLHNRMTNQGSQWFLRKVVLLLCPRMTTQVGGLYEDLHSYEVPKLCCAPLQGDGQADLSDLSAPWIREVHATLKPSYDSYVLHDEVEIFLYVDFLVHGPYFEDDLMRSLGCSSPRYSRESLYCEGTMKLGFINT